MSFQIHALPAAPFRPLFAMPDEALARVRARRVVVDAKPGYPCRVSLADAEVGETVILTNYEHQPADSPYRSSHAVFVREHAEQAFPAVGTVPEVLTTRRIAIRAFDRRHDMRTAEIVEGAELARAIPTLLAEPGIAYLHLHNAARGCYAARVTRA